MTREGFLGVNMTEELVLAVERFVKGPHGKALGMNERPDLFETAAVLFLAQYLPEFRKAIDAFKVDEATIRKVVIGRRAIITSATQEAANHETEPSRSPDSQHT